MSKSMELEEKERGTALLEECLYVLEAAGFSTEELRSQELSNTEALIQLARNEAAESSPLLNLLKELYHHGIDTSETIDRIQVSVESIEHADKVFMEIVAGDNLEEMLDDVKEWIDN